MKNEFIPYDIALAMKEIGFDEPCVATFHDNSGGEIEFTFGMFHHPKKNSEANTVSGTFIGKNGCYAPLYQQAFRWFRKKYRLLHFITPNTTRGGWDIQVIHYNGYKILYENNDNDLKYEEAELACLKKLIEIVKENL